MAAPQNKIGPHAFIRIAGPLEGAVRQVEILRRSGVDGVALWDTGERGRPVRVVAEVDVQDRITAELKMQEFREMIGTDPVEVIWNDIPFTAVAQVKFSVLDVRKVRSFRILTSSGGLVAGAQAFLISQWVLIPIPVEVS